MVRADFGRRYNANGSAGISISLSQIPFTGLNPMTPAADVTVSVGLLWLHDRKQALVIRKRANSLLRGGDRTFHRHWAFGEGRHRRQILEGPRR